MKTEYKIIVDLIEKKTRVLDVGCDDETLMESLKKNKNVFLKFANYLPEAVFITDASGNVVFLNQVGENIFGANPNPENEKNIPEEFKNLLKMNFLKS